VGQALQNYLTTILGVQAGFGTGKYFGLPYNVGRSKNATFSFIKDRVFGRKLIHGTTSVSPRQEEI